MSIKVYEVSLETLKPYIEWVDTEVLTIYNLFGCTTRLVTENMKPHQKVYICVTYNFDQPVRVEISKTRRLEHMGIEQSDLLDDLKEMNYLKEDSVVLKKFKIKAVSIKKEIKKIQLESSVETLISTGCLGEGASIKVDEGVPYLVQGGEVEELTGEGFSAKAEKFLVGKTIGFLEDLSTKPKNKGYVMIHLINGMNLIESIELERASSSILGI